MRTMSTDGEAAGSRRFGRLRRGRGADPEGRMSVIQHLEEMRTRLVRSIVFFALAIVACFFLYDAAIEIISKPYLAAVGGGDLFVLGPKEAIGLKLKIVAYMALGLTIPYALWEVYRFVAPGMTGREKRWTLPFIPLSFLFFCLGVYFGFLTMPAALSWIVGFAGDNVKVLPVATNYLGFAAFMLLGFGLTFQFPLVLLLLQAARVVDWRRLLGFWRYAIVIIVLLAAVITPSQDPWSLALMVVPMIVFYFGAIAAGFVLFRKRNAELDADAR